jgi:hypothetical protein
MPFDPYNLDPTPLVLRWQALRLRQNDVERYSGIDDTKISRIVNRQENFNYREWKHLEEVLSDLEEISQRTQGAVNWRNGEIVRRMLADLSEERLHPPKPLDSGDFEILGATTPEAIRALAAKRGISVPELLVAIEAATKKFDYTLHQLRRGTADSRALTKLLNEGAEKRSK